jgi:hypothetical protein
MNRMRIRLFFAATFIAAGAATALVSRPAEASAARLEECEKDVCSVESGNCFNSDITWQCKETWAGCEMSQCGAS